MSNSKDFDEEYEKLKLKLHASVENLVQWLKDAKLLEKAKITEDAAKKMFKDAKKEVPLAEFKEVAQKVAAEAKMTTAQMMEEMVKSRKVLQDAVGAAGTAFSKTLATGADDSKNNKK